MAQTVQHSCSIIFRQVFHTVKEKSKLNESFAVAWLLQGHMGSGAFAADLAHLWQIELAVCLTKEAQEGWLESQGGNALYLDFSCLFMRPKQAGYCLGCMEPNGNHRSLPNTSLPSWPQASMAIFINILSFLFNIYKDVHLHLPAQNRFTETREQCLR